MSAARKKQRSYTYPWPKADVTVDCVVFGLRLEEGRLKVLLIKRAIVEEPFFGSWALPGGFIDMAEPLEASALRKLREETGVALSFMEQLYTFGEPKRDPRGRVLSVAWLGLVRPEHLEMPTQRHASENFNRVREMIIDGAIGELSAVHAWGNRQLRRPGYLPAAGTPPKGIHYDLWLGPICQPHAYNYDYFSGRPGANCLQWNMYWDFGTGQVGDMGSHTMDLAWNALDAELPTSARGEGEPFNPEVSPVELHTSFKIPENNWRPGIRLHWHQGGAMPDAPIGYIDLNKIGHGALFRGSRGFLVADFDTRVLLLEELPLP
jgi:ADP-ribose pyrophosphatase YjhB (NUDIX family)